MHRYQFIRFINNLTSSGDNCYCLFHSIIVLSLYGLLKLGVGSCFFTAAIPFNFALS